MMYKISKQNTIPSKWDGGLTYEYFIYPQESNYSDRNFDFRISSATIEKIPSHFTHFSGYFRYLVMLENSLNIFRNKTNESFAKHEVFKFDSNENIVSNSLGDDFNLMISNRFSDHDLILFEVNAIINSDWIILFSLSENVVSIDNMEHKLIANDCILIENYEKVNVEISTLTKIILATINR